ncbi:hypothetical protein B0H13DRAFT_460702 [Mycena leptocephala]|nr:hypothetical protein B0H13DRAFT_460702 [Mycena leptocephala]
MTGHSKRTVLHPSRTPPKSYECVVCHESFSRLCDLRTHEKMHTGKQAFACNFPGCLKRFGVRSNLQRHQVAHGIRTTSGRSIMRAAPYEIKFEPHPPCPTLLSDTTSMPTGILWDREGPFTRRPIESPRLQSVALYR